MRQRLVITLVTTFVVAYGLLLLTVATGTKPALGLDLQGGVSVTQRAVNGATCEDPSMKLAVEKIRERVDSLGVAEPEILCQGDTVVVNLPGVRNQRQAEELVQVTGQVWLRPVLGCQQIEKPGAATGDTTVDSTGGTDGGSTTSSAATTTTAAGGPSRPVSAGNTTTTVAGETTTTVVAAPTGAGETTTTVSGTSTSTTAAPLDENGFPVQQSRPNETQVLPVKGKPEDAFVLFCQVGPQQGSGEVFQDNASAQVLNGGWGVDANLRDGAAGEDIWNNIAGQCYNKASACPSGQLTIEVDGEIQSAPTVNEPVFTGGVSITGSFTESEARNLANVINSGALPVELKLESVQTVSATLGKDSLQAAIIAGLIGVGLVLLFMIFYYRLLGVIVAVGITISFSLLWGIVSILSKTSGLALSLSGIAGIIVSVGVTVDSYVVYFERLKDEVKAGRSLRNSAQRGFQGAWRTIVIADLVSLIGAAVLWYLSVGAVRGFAFFLGLSTAIDLVVAYCYTRPTVLLLSRTKWMERRKVMGIEVATAGGAS